MQFQYKYYIIVLHWEVCDGHLWSPRLNPCVGLKVYHLNVM